MKQLTVKIDLLKNSSYNLVYRRGYVADIEMFYKKYSKAYKDISLKLTVFKKNGLSNTHNKCKAVYIMPFKIAGRRN